ncbi:MAG TPA: phospholipase D family protein [Gemmatimonadales bacterium]|nr:phospholipase D family protein [Gemmatimonadales bacterium]
MTRPRGRGPSLLAGASLLLALGCGREAPPAGTTTADDADFCAAIGRDTSLHLARQLAPVESLMAARTGVYVLEDGDGAMIARAWLSEYAERTIDVQYFIFSADNVGLIAADYLVRAAERGVRVRVLVDDVLVEADADALLTLDAQPNLEIRIYNPTTNVGKSLPRKLLGLATNFRGVNQRMHNKTFTVDGRVTITGGRNIADEYFDYDHEYNFRDRDVLLIGGIVPEIERSFEAFWGDSLSRPVAELVGASPGGRDDAARVRWLHQYACNPANYWPQVRERLQGIPDAFRAINASGALQWLDSVTYVSDRPGKNDGTQGLGGGGATLDALTALVRQARTSIDIQSPYLVMTAEGQELFRDAVARGVAVRILTNSLASTDNLEAFSGYQRDREALLGTGVRIFEFRPDAAERATVMTGALQATLDHAPIFGLHAKTMVIDGHITVIGTFNLDPRSANLNTECVTVIHSDAVAAGVLAGMETEFGPGNAWETTLDSNPDAYAGAAKRVKVWTRRIVPKQIL